MAKKNSFLKIFLIITLVFSFIGLGSDFLVQKLEWQDISNDLTDAMDVSLAAVNPERIQRQAQTPESIDNPDYSRLKEQLLELGRPFTRKGIDSIYAMSQKDGKILFLVDSVSTDHPRYSPPGTIYEEPPQILLDIFKNGKEAMSDPYTDEYGSFVSFFKPIRTFDDDQIVGIMGVDIDYAWALNKLRSFRIYSLSIVTITYLFALLFFYLFFKRRASKQQLLENQRMHEALVQGSSDAIMTLEPPDWKFTSGNPAAIKMFGAKNEAEFTSKHPGQLSPEKQSDGKSSPEQAKKMIEKALLKGSNFFEWTHKRINGETFPAEVLLTKFEIDGEPILQATVRDISKRKKEEKQALEQKRELEELNSLMVGREIKIIELKEELAKLKDELNKK